MEAGCVFVKAIPPHPCSAMRTAGAHPQRSRAGYAITRRLDLPHEAEAGRDEFYGLNGLRFGSRPARTLPSSARERAIPRLPSGEPQMPAGLSAIFHADGDRRGARLRTPLRTL